MPVDLEFPDKKIFCLSYLTHRRERHAATKRLTRGMDETEERQNGSARDFNPIGLRRRRTVVRTFFIMGLAFLWIRNAPLALILPLWSFGDEMGHLDYVLKLEQGRLPSPDDRLEASLFLLHKARYDGRYLYQQKEVTIRKPKDLGLASYTYEAHQPPLPYIIMAAFRAPMRAFGLSLFAQVKGLRLLGLLVMTAALAVLYRALSRRPHLGVPWSLPLLLIPLLSQDMYFSINTDVYAFLFGSLAVLAIFRLFDNPLSWSSWAFLAAAIGMAAWAKATTAFLLALWPILTAVLVWISDGGARRRKIATLGIFFFALAVTIAAPWYLGNMAKSPNFFGYQISDRPDSSFKFYEHPRLNRPQVRLFAEAFDLTLIRGEFLWRGAYFDALPAPINSPLLFFGFWIFFVSGLLGVIFPLKQNPPGLTFVFTAGGIGVVGSLFLLHFAWGEIPLYHARYAFAGLYCLMFLYATGWRRLIPNDTIAAIVPSVLLLGYNAVYTVRLLAKVLA